MKSKLFYIAFLVIPQLLFSQQDAPTTMPAPEVRQDIPAEAKSDIYLFSKSTENGLLLRWAPSSPDIWLKGNTFGYTIEKLVFESGDKNFQAVGGKVFKPWPLNDWKSIVTDETPYTAAAAMAIYGEEKGGGKGMVVEAQNLENKFGFALLAADLDKKAAEASGLLFMDGDLERHSMVGYRISINDPSTGALSDTTYQLFRYGDPEPLNSPPLLAPEENERSITLRWKKMPVGQQFSGYHIERSADDGKTFERLTQTPFLDISTNLLKDKQFITFIDSVDQNYKPYQYRILAIDAFGDESEYSEVITAMGRDRTPPASPQKFVVSETPEHFIKMDWDYTVSEDDFEGFLIYKTVDKDLGYTAISTLLPKTSRSFIDEKPDGRATNFYYVVAVDKEGNEGSSVVNFGITTDETPPQAPNNLRASIDTLGQLLLEWDAPADKDIRGYLVHYSNSPDAEYAVIPGDYLPNTHFVDVLTLQTLTEEIFYYVIAVDYSYNASVASEVLRVKKPDLIPPVASIFVDYSVSEVGISFEWVKSTSDDVERVELKRKFENGVWETIEEFDQNSSAFIDKNVMEGRYYEYALHTFDDDGNVTIGEKHLSLEALKSFYLKETPSLLASSEKEGIVLNIDYPNSNGFEFTIYKAVGDNPLTTYKKLNQTITFTDKDVRKKVKYQYAVIANAQDGRDSKMSQPVMVKN